jgi:hypothetical protein
MVSAGLHVAVAAWAIVAPLRNVGSAPVDALDIGAVVATLAGPGIVAGWAAILSFLVVLLCSQVLLQPHIGHRVFRTLELLAFVPPSLLAAVGLAVVRGPSTQLLIGYSLLWLYGAALVLFLSNRQQLLRQRTILFNSRQLPARRRLYVVIASAVGGLAMPCMVSLYFLWIEDGMQVSVLASDRSLANVLRGLGHSALTAGTYLGACCCFAVWGICWAASSYVTRRRFAWVAKRLARTTPRCAVVATVAAMVTLCARPVVAQLSVSKAESRTTPHIASCDNGLVGLAANEKLSVVGGMTCSAVHISEVVLNHAGTSIIKAKGRLDRLEIDRIVYRWNAGLLRIEGEGENARVREVIIHNLDRPKEGGNTQILLEVEGIEIGTLRIDGGSGGAVDVTVRETAVVSNVRVHGITAHTIDVTVLESGRGEVYLDDVTVESIRVEGRAEPPGRSAAALPRARNAGEQEGGQGLDLFIGARSAPAVSLLSVLIEGVSIERGEVMLRDVTGSVPSTGVVSLRRLRLNRRDTGLTVRREKGNVELRGEDVRGKGLLAVDTPGIVELSLWQMGKWPGDGESDLPSVAVKAGSVVKSAFVGLNLESLQLCEAESGAQRAASIETFRDVAVADVVTVSQSLMELERVALKLPFHRNEFYRLLQQHGQYCDSGASVGLDALHARKSGEVREVSGLLRWILEWVTGFGVSVTEPCVTFVVLLCAHLMLRIVILMAARRAHGGKTAEEAAGQWTITKEAFAGVLGGEVDQGIAQPYAFALIAVRSLVGAAILFQITACSVYFSQTTLQ